MAAAASGPEDPADDRSKQPHEPRLLEALGERNGQGRQGRDAVRADGHGGDVGDLLDRGVVVAGLRQRVPVRGRRRGIRARDPAGEVERQIQTGVARVP